MREQHLATKYSIAFIKIYILVLTNIHVLMVYKKIWVNLRRVNCVILAGFNLGIFVWEMSV